MEARRLAGLGARDLEKSSLALRGQLHDFDQATSCKLSTSNPPSTLQSNIANMVQPSTARLLQATRARFFQPGLNRQAGYVMAPPAFHARAVSPARITAGFG